ncbi:MobF family relaxase [Nocardia sp. NPDC052278]|uniref:MobF family relaxase n=1 Tax=unclassified Nocardia TaxID=2637762 RepID=UPI003698500E
MSDYYAAHGESPGRWFGTGLHGLTVTHGKSRLKCSRLKAGDTVTEEQMNSLFGLGRHPQANQIEATIVANEVARGAKRKDAKRVASEASRLGDPFRIYTGATEFRRRCAVAFSDYNLERGLDEYAAIPDAERADIRTAIARTMFVEQFSRPPLDERELSGWVARNNRQRTTAVAGFDWTFSPVKSVSTLWAVAPRAISEKIEAAHRAAVADSLAFLEANAAYTRLGRNGVRQVGVEGLIAAAFEHRDSRSGDPDLHTHLVVANRVRTRVGDRWVWRTLDGTMFYRAAVCASEIYNTRLEMHLEMMLGLEFAVRPGTDPAKRAIREIVGVDPRLNELWSSRDAAITARLGQLTVAFQHVLGREPTADEMYGLMEQATLDTRDRKQQMRSLAEQRATWYQQAVKVLGGPEHLTAMIAAALRPRRFHRAIVDAQWISNCANRVIATVSAERSTWTRVHVRSEVERLLRGVIRPEQWAQVSSAVVDAALSPSRSVARGDPDIRAEPELRTAPSIFRRPDGTSVYRAADSQLYTSPHILTTEAQLIEMSLETGGRTVPAAIVEAAVKDYNNDPDNRDKQLNAGQIATVRAFATSGARIQIANAPAGTGKTSSMSVLADAWRASGGTVLGHAPTAKSVGELGADIHARVATVDKLLDVLARHTPTREHVLLTSDAPPPSLPQWVLDIDSDTLVIVDEHVQISDADRLRMLIFLRSRNATVRFIGDDEQLSAIDAGGAVHDMIDATGDWTQTLTHVVRFRDDAEASASLLLREGDPAGLGFYLDRGRVHVGSPASVADGAFAGWLADYAAGLDTVMLGATHEIVGELNSLARADRLARAGTDTGIEVKLADGLSASAGDTIRTGLNNPKLIVGADDYVRNGYQWVITTVHADGSITATHLKPHRTFGESVALPADYVRANVRLGYASTINSAQGITADTCHTALTGHESRRQLYVALTRGRLSNHIYLTTTIDGSEQSFWSELAVLPRTAVEVLIRILSRDGAQRSAHTELREALDPWQRLGRAVDIYLDALALATEYTLGEPAMTQLDIDVEHLLPGLTISPGYAVLRQNLATIMLHGRDAIAALRAAISAREIDTADQIAAVLDWRLDTSGAHSANPGPLPWLPGMPAGLREAPDVAGFLIARESIITHLAQEVGDDARAFTPSTAPVWARPLVGADPALLADVAVWRAAAHVDAGDLRPCGPSRFTATERRHYDHLAVRVAEAIGDVNLAVNKWAPTAKRIDARILTDAFWPILADHLETANRAGIDVEAMLTTAAAIRPLPDELPAAALWSRLSLQPSALDSNDSGNTRLAPAWAPELHAVLGADTAERVIADPAWPKVVAAVEHAMESQSQWTARELLEVTCELLISGRADRADVLRPDQLATALAWRIDAIIHDVPTYPDAPLPTEPPDLADDVADGPDEFHRTSDFDVDPPTPTEHTMVDDAVPTHPFPVDDSPPTPDPATARTSSPVELADEIRSVAARFKAGDITSVTAAITQLTDIATDEQRKVMRRIANTLAVYAFPIARARLRRAADQFPAHAALIHAFIPEADPGLYQPDTDSPAPTYRRDRAPRDSRRWVDRTRAQPLTPGRNDRLEDHDLYLDDTAEQQFDQRPRHSPVFAERRDYDADTLRGPWDLPCVGCGLDRPTIDRPRPDIATGGSESDDGLCVDCRDNEVPGIPAHDSARYLQARCAYVADTRTPADALAFLRRDWRRVGGIRRRMIAHWITEHGLDIAAAPDSPRALPDAVLMQRIGEVRQQIALADAMDSVLDSPSTAIPTADDRNAGIAAADAITHARSAAAAVEEFADRINTIARQAARARTDIASATARLAALTMQRQELIHNAAPAEPGNSDLDAIAHQIEQVSFALSAATSTRDTLSTAKQQLIQDRDNARRIAQAAERDAALLAGPRDRWDDILAHPGRVGAGGDATTHTKPEPRTDITHLERQLADLRAESRRRDLLTPERRAIEDRHRDHYGMTPSPAEPDPVESPTEVRGEDLEL